ncbi:hypothetical protein VCCP1035_2714B, partial [Vibrio cholerae CP1035(8)]
QCRTP